MSNSTSVSAKGSRGEGPAPDSAQSQPEGCLARLVRSVGRCVKWLFDQAACFFRALFCCPPSDRVNSLSSRRIASASHRASEGTSAPEEAPSALQQQPGYSHSLIGPYKYTRGDVRLNGNIYFIENRLPEMNAPVWILKVLVEGQKLPFYFTQGGRSTKFAELFFTEEADLEKLDRFPAVASIRESELAYQKAIEETTKEQLDALVAWALKNRE